MIETCRCPKCKGPTTLDKSNPWRPFCSERCRLIDLGDWVSEKNRIPSDEGGFLEDPDYQKFEH